MGESEVGSSPQDSSSLDSSSLNPLGPFRPLFDALEQSWIARHPIGFAVCCKQSQQLASRHEIDPSLPTLELANIDLELSWRYETPRAAASRCVGRTLGWYREQPCLDILTVDQWDTLAVHELDVRSHWGDQPRLDKLVDEQFPTDAKSDQRLRETRYRCVLEKRFPIAANVRFHGTQRFQSPLQTPCLVRRVRSIDGKDASLGMFRDDLESGNAGKHDEVAQDVDAGTDHWKMLVARRHENFVSRKQLLLKRVAASALELTPLSENVPVFVHAVPLEHGQPTTLKISRTGSTVTFGGVEISFQSSFFDLHPFQPNVD